MICITHEHVKGYRPCVRRDEHLTTCMDETCTGCMPRRAVFGLLCASCFGKVERAAAAYWSFLRVFYRVDIAVTPSGGGSRSSGPRLPLSRLTLDTDEIRSLMDLLPDGDDARDWVNTDVDARAALRFTRRMEQIARTHPWEESTHPVQIARCPRCALRALRWQPPAQPYFPVTVACSAPGCGYEMSQDRFEVLADIEERASRGRAPLGPLEAWCTEFRNDPDRGNGMWPRVDQVEAALGVRVWIDNAAPAAKEGQN